jgi:16S rRNA (guanine(966)-N(2))-methyltransferase RsmD
MRIVGGKYRGKKLVEHYNDTTRPTTDRVRENVFNVLAGSVDGLRVLDLFAGTGAYGLEAHSRGASSVVFADVDPVARDVIKRNCSSIGCDYIIYDGDYKSVLDGCKKHGKRFDLIFLDPPYNTGCGISAVQLILEYGLLSDGGVIVFETDVAQDFEVCDLLVKEKKYGRALVYFLYN